jgi:hypothetical protein
LGLDFLQLDLSLGALLVEMLASKRRGRWALGSCLPGAGKGLCEELRMGRENEPVGFELLDPANDGHIRERLVVEVAVRVRPSCYTVFGNLETYFSSEPREVPTGLFAVVGVYATRSP